MARDTHPKFDPKIHHRKSIRLQGYDYTQAGAYFVTIVTYQRDCLFGKVVNGEMRLNDFGKIVHWEWLDLPKRFRYIDLGAYMVMPNHFHGILNFHETAGATRHGLTDAPVSNVPLPTLTTDCVDGSPLPRGPKPASLGAIVSQFKSRVTKQLWKIPSLNGTPIWQRNYHEHIIRNEREMDNIWRYIESNPARWDDDDENPHT
ncbi:MAG: transposase [Chloroflexi bacterium]|nr:transposase [Chloroflexota bacterium]